MVYHHLLSILSFYGFSTKNYLGLGVHIGMGKHIIAAKNPIGLAKVRILPLVPSLLYLTVSPPLFLALFQLLAIPDKFETRSSYQ